MGSKITKKSGPGIRNGIVAGQEHDRDFSPYCGEPPKQWRKGEWQVSLPFSHCSGLAISQAAQPTAASYDCAHCEGVEGIMRYGGESSGEAGDAGDVGGGR